MGGESSSDTIDTLSSVVATVLVPLSLSSVLPLPTLVGFTVSSCWSLTLRDLTTSPSQVLALKVCVPPGLTLVYVCLVLFLLDVKFLLCFTLPFV